jgi:hypothetical protein
MAWVKLILNTKVVVEPKAKRKYKTKKEKKNDTFFIELTTIGKVMIEDELHEEEAQSLRELVEEEVAMAIPYKTKKKKMKGKGEAKLSKCLPKKGLFPSSPKVREELKQM